MPYTPIIATLGYVMSPDGRQVAYSSDRAGTEDIYVRDLRSGKQRRVTALPSAEVSASFGHG